jgi:hypothetical protein
MGWDRWARLLLALVAAMVLTCSVIGCGGDDGDDNGGSSTQITGVVVDQQTSEPVIGATVSVGGSSTRTNDSGSFEMGVSPGTITVTVTAPGYQNGNFSAVADEGLKTNVGILPLLNADNNPPQPPI